MNCQHNLYKGQDPKLVTRRWFFRQCGVGLGSIALSSLLSVRPTRSQARPQRLADRIQVGAVRVRVTAGIAVDEE